MTFDKDGDIWEPEIDWDASRAACDHQNYGGGTSIDLSMLLTREEKYIEKVKLMTFSERCMEWERVKDKPLLSKWFTAWAKKCRSAALKQRVFGRKINFEF